MRPFHLRDRVGELLDQMIVSHRARAKNQGQLHDKTAYGILRTNKKGVSLVVSRRMVESFESKKHLEEIKDNQIREDLLALSFDASENRFLSGTELKKAVLDYCNANARVSGG